MYQINEGTGGHMSTNINGSAHKWVDNGGGAGINILTVSSL
jgi:hypothetical protein